MDALLKTTSKKDQKLALSSINDLRSASSKLRTVKDDGVRIKIQDTGEFITIPKKAISLLFAIIANMAEGKSITLIPSDSELTTQQAADMLNVSRPHIVKLLNKGEIDYKKVGSHRRIRLKDLIKYETKSSHRRDKNLDFLANQAQELNMGYE